MLADPISSVKPESGAAAIIAAASPFADLPEQVISALAEASSLRDYAAGETVFAMGQYDGSEFLIVGEGKLKAAFVDPATGSMLIEHVAAGGTFGLAQAVCDNGAGAGLSLTAERDSQVLAVDAAVLRNIAAQRPSLSRNLMLHFAQKLLGGAQSAEESSPDRRVYAALANMVERDPISAEWRIPRMPKHRELADRADVDEGEAANAVAKLIQKGVARRNYPGLIIDDMAQLNRLSR